MATYTATFTREGSRIGRTIYSGPSHAAAKRAAAEALGYRRIESAYSYASTNQHGEDGVFYCRRPDAGGEDFDVVCVVRN